MSRSRIERRHGRKFCPVVQNDIRISLIKPGLAYLFGADARRCNIRDRAVLKFDPGIRRIDLIRDHRYSDRPDLRYSYIFPDQPLDRIEIVDHYVKHDIDIERTVGKGRYTVDLEVQRPRDMRPKRDHRWIIAFELADHEFCA